MKILLRLTAYGLRSKRQLAGAYLSMAITAALYMLIPKLLGTAVDEALASGLQSQLLTLSGAIIGIAAFRSVVQYAQENLLEGVTHRVGYDLRNDLFQKLQHLSFGYHDRQQTGNLMSRATTDVDAARVFPAWGLGHAGFLLLYVGGATVLMVSINWRLALIAVGFAAVALWRSLMVIPRMAGYWRAAQEETGHMTTVVQESLTGMRVVKAFGAGMYEQGKFEAKATAVRESMSSASMISATRSALSALLLNAAMGLVLLVGAWEVAAGRLTAGDAAAFLLYMGIVAGEVSWAGFMIVTFSRAVAAGRRLFEVLDAESPVKEKPDAVFLPRVRGHVNFHQVSLKYDSGVPAVHDVSFEAHPGQLVAVLGAPGSGKSTLVHLIPRFYDVSDGSIALDGTDVRDVTLESLRANVGIVLQDSFAFAATIRDNITYGVDGASMDDVVGAAQVAQIHQWVEGLPEGYDTWVGERGITLSGGQRQRLAIARTILLDPPILILDDSTSSVDVGTEHLIQQALAEVIRGRTTFVIAHRLSTVRNADLIVVLDRGEIVESGTHQELLALDGYYRRIHDLQLRPREGVERPQRRAAPAGGVT